MRLLDYLVNGGWNMDDIRPQLKTSTTWKNAAHAIVPVDISSVARDNIGREENIKLDHLRCVPPFRDSFIETSALPEWVRFTQSSLRISHLGALVRMFDTDGLSDDVAHGHKWMVQISTIARVTGTGSGCFVVWNSVVVLRDDGSPSTKIPVYDADFHMPSRNSDAERTWREGWGKWMEGAVLFSCALMNCRNISIVDDHPPRHIRRAAMRRGDAEPIVYRVLRVDPNRTPQPKNASGSESGSLIRRLHICRGHFATYKEPGLFGKYPGTFWVPMHTRGSAKSGRVEKDYAVLPASFPSEEM